MLNTVIGWAFVSFIYFNVTFGWLLKRADISVLSALLLAVAVGVTIAAVEDVYRNRLFRYYQLPGLLSVGYSTLARNTVVPFLVSVAAFVLVARLIEYGSSAVLTDGKVNVAVYDSGGDDFFTICLIMAAPLMIHWLMCLHEAHNNANGESFDV